jgi:hypothetical protein
VPAADETAPAVALTAPGDGSTVSGATRISADAADEVGVAKVDFLVNGTVVGSTTAAPYAATWSSASVPDGPVTIAARASDAAGNTALSTSRTVIVDNTAPDTAITSAAPPADGTATIAFTSPEPGASFQCALDGAAWTACASPQALSGVPAGVHTYRVRAVDAAGNADPTPATVSWTVAGAPPPPPPPPPSNLIVNGGFENGLTGWYGYHATLSLVAGAVGANAARVVLNAGTGFSVITASAPITTSTAGTVLRVSASVRSDVAGRTVCLRIRETAAGATLGGNGSCLVATADWQQFPVVVYTVQASGSAIDVYAYIDPAVAGDSFDLDEVSLQ